MLSIAKTRMEELRSGWASLVFSGLGYVGFPLLPTGACNVRQRTAGSRSCRHDLKFMAWIDHWQEDKR